MKEAPEQIWAAPTATTIGTYLTFKPVPADTSVEYIPRAAADTMLAAALEGAANRCWKAAEITDSPHAEFELCQAAEAIRAMIPATPSKEPPLTWQEQAARWHEEQAVSVMGGLSCKQAQALLTLEHETEGSGPMLLYEAAPDLARALIAMTEDRDLSVAEAHQMGEERAQWKERAEVAEAEHDALTDRLALAFSEAAGVAICMADGFRDQHTKVSAPPIGTWGHDRWMQAEASSRAVAAAIRALAPVPPLAAAMRLPEVVAMREALGVADQVARDLGWHRIYDKTGPALAALEAAELQGVE